MFPVISISSSKMSELWTTWNKQATYGVYKNEFCAQQACKLPKITLTSVCKRKKSYIPVKFHQLKN